MCTHTHTHRISVELANLCLVPQYLVLGGIYELHTFMTIYTHISCIVPWLYVLDDGSITVIHIRESLM